MRFPVSIVYTAVKQTGKFHFRNLVYFPNNTISFTGLSLGSDTLYFPSNTISFTEMSLGSDSLTPYHSQTKKSTYFDRKMPTFNLI